MQWELWGSLDAGIGHEGNYPDGFTPWQAWVTYNHFVCLVGEVEEIKAVEVVGME